MSITVTITGLNLSAIVWRWESLWEPSAIYVHHQIKGATKGPYYAQGTDNATATIEGRCERNAANETLLRSMLNKSATIQGMNSHTARITSIVDNSPSNPAWIFFTMTCMEV